MSIAFRVGQIIRCDGQPPLENGLVIVDGRRIAWIGASDDPARPRQEPESLVELPAATLLPGLIDCHVHLAGEIERRQSDDPARDVGAGVISTLLAVMRMLREGITALRDCGYPHHGIFAVRDSIVAGAVDGPRLFLSGRAICASGGHGASISVEVDGADETRKAVRRELKAGADWVKLMVTGGTATPGERPEDVQLTLEEMRSAVDEAERRGRRVCAHTSCLAGATADLAAGVHSIEHGIHLDEETARQMAERGVYLVPSLKCTQIEALSGPESGIAEYIREKAAAIYEQQVRSFGIALRAGVPIAAGTDAGPFYFPLSRASLVAELGAMVDAGMSPTQALESATRWAANLLGVADLVGSIEAGKEADLLIVDGDPLGDLNALNRLLLVMQAGRIVTDARSGLGQSEL